MGVGGEKAVRVREGGEKEGRDERERVGGKEEGR